MITFKIIHTKYLPVEKCFGQKKDVILVENMSHYFLSDKKGK